MSIIMVMESFSLGDRCRYDFGQAIDLIINLNRPQYTAEVRHLIVGEVMILEGVVALVLPLIYCP